MIIFNVMYCSVNKYLAKYLDDCLAIYKAKQLSGMVDMVEVVLCLCVSVAGCTFVCFF